MNIEVKVKIDDDDNILSNFSESKKLKIGVEIKYKSIIKS